MRKILCLALVLVILVAGCVEEPEKTPPQTVPVMTTPTGTVPAAGDTPATPAPAPVQKAIISGIRCAVGDRSEDAYHCNGNVRISSGSYNEVQVIAVYPDNNTFRSGTVALGGGDVISKPFVLFPDPKYQGQTPAYFVKMDGVTYPVVGSGDGGTAWANLPA